MVYFLKILFKKVEKAFQEFTQQVLLAKLFRPFAKPNTTLTPVIITN